MVPAVRLGREVRGMVRIAGGGVEVNHPVEPAARPYPMVHRLASPFGLLAPVEGSAERRDGRPLHAHVLGMSPDDDLSVGIDNLPCRGIEVARALARANVIYPLEDHEPTNAGLRQHVALQP